MNYSLVPGTTSGQTKRKGTVGRKLFLPFCVLLAGKSSLESPATATVGSEINFKFMGKT
jgi:hypothetical protein